MLFIVSRFESFYVKLLYFQELLDQNYDHDSAVKGKIETYFANVLFIWFYIDVKTAFDYCSILLIFYLGLRSAHSVYHLDADEDEDEWSE